MSRLMHSYCGDDDTKPTGRRHGCRLASRKNPLCHASGLDGSTSRRRNSSFICSSFRRRSTSTKPISRFSLPFAFASWMIDRRSCASNFGSRRSQALICSSAGKSEIFDRFLEEFRAIAISFLPHEYDDRAELLAADSVYSSLRYSRASFLSFSNAKRGSGI